MGAIAAILRLIYFAVGADALRGTWVQTVSAIVLDAGDGVRGLVHGHARKTCLKKRLAYSSVSQLSYVLLGVLLMTPGGAARRDCCRCCSTPLAKIGVFLCAGSAIFLTGTETLDGFPGLGRRLPATMVCFTLLSLSLVGIPPFGGFFSKWYLISAALADVPGALGFVIAGVLLFSALLTAGLSLPTRCAQLLPGASLPRRGARGGAAHDGAAVRGDGGGVSAARAVPERDPRGAARGRGIHSVRRCA